MAYSCKIRVGNPHFTLSKTNSFRGNYSLHILHLLEPSQKVQYETFFIYPFYLLLFLAGDYNWRDNFNVDVVYKVCYICHEKFLGLHQLTKHLRLHREIDFDCLVCSKKLSSGFLLHEHMRYHYNTKEITLTETETNKTGHNSNTG